MVHIDKVPILGSLLLLSFNFEKISFRNFPIPSFRLRSVYWRIHQYLLGYDTERGVDKDVMYRRKRTRQPVHVLSRPPAQAQVSHPRSSLTRPSSIESSSFEPFPFRDCKRNESVALEQRGLGRQSRKEHLSYPTRRRVLE